MKRHAARTDRGGGLTRKKISHAEGLSDKKLLVHFLGDKCVDNASDESHKALFKVPDIFPEFVLRTL
ncbi:hypothetical protein DP117_10635 [Brasilonema sp. UFV-L1]|nr:hypothetical protein [Brasilonema sp. UFV-L1]